MAIRRANAAARRASYSVTSERSPAPYSTASISTSKCPRSHKALRGRDDGVSSAQIRERVIAARAIQQSRGYYNAHIPARQLRKHCALDDSGERTLEMAVRRMGLPRAHDRILKLARTIADLDASAAVSAKHLAEVVKYRSLDRSYWT